MNDQMEKLPADKRDRIINGALDVFGRHEYRKASVEEITQRAGISKGLLYHYFSSKSQLYVELYAYSCDCLLERIISRMDPEETDFFAVMHAGMEAKLTIMGQYPAMLDFIVKAYYESDPAVADEIRAFNTELIAQQGIASFARVDRSKFRPDITLEQAIQTIQWCAEGYLTHIRGAGTIDLQAIAADFEPCFAMFRRAFYKEEFI